MNYITENQQRYSSALWYQQSNNYSVHIIGLGTIGSFTALAMSRLGCLKILLQDNDIVEFKNMAGQIYGLQHINGKKTECLRELIYDFSDKEVTMENVMFLENAYLYRNIIITGLDNMKSRKDVYYSFIRSTNTTLLIDGRMLAEDFDVYCLDKDSPDYEDNRALYESRYLYSSEEAEEGPCSYKSTTYIGMMIGGYITNLVANYLSNKALGAAVKQVPFISKYVGSLTCKM